MKHARNLKIRFWRGLWLAPLAVFLILSSGAAMAQDPVSAINDSEQSLMEYWTQERMDSAVPRELLEADPDATAAQSDGAEAYSGPPSFVPGYKPGETPTDPLAAVEVKQSSEEALTSPPFSSPGFSTDWNNYPPYQRWSWFGRYLTYPTSTVGKLFFTLPGYGNYVCSASVIGTHVIATAGHCVADYGVRGTNFLFCPSYNRISGTNPTRGCWGWRGWWTTAQWFNSRNFDRDYACIYLNRTNSTTFASVGSQTGVLGRAYNWPSKHLEIVHGYPVGSPFPSSPSGIHTCASTEWYQRDTQSGDGQVSKYIGCDMTGGSSGGPWWQNIRSPNTSFEVTDVDNSNITDPGNDIGSGGPFLNGVTSHRRTGYVSELASAQFKGGNFSDSNESEDIFALCFSDQ